MSWCDPVKTQAVSKEEEHLNHWNRKQKVAACVAGVEVLKTDVRSSKARGRTWTGAKGLPPQRHGLQLVEHNQSAFAEGSCEHEKNSLH